MFVLPRIYINPQHPNGRKDTLRKEKLIWEATSFGVLLNAQEILEIALKSKSEGIAISIVMRDSLHATTPLCVARFGRFAKTFIGQWDSKYRSIATQMAERHLRLGNGMSLAFHDSGFLSSWALGSPSIDVATACDHKKMAVGVTGSDKDNNHAIARGILKASMLYLNAAIESRKRNPDKHIMSVRRSCILTIAQRYHIDIERWRLPIEWHSPMFGKEPLFWQKQRR